MGIAICLLCGHMTDDPRLYRFGIWLQALASLVNFHRTLRLHLIDDNKIGTTHLHLYDNLPL